MNDSPVVHMPHPDQCLVAEELGIDVAALTSVDVAVTLIEEKLGKEAIEARARWFVLSVLRYLNKEKWTALPEGQLSDARQISLAKDCLAVEGFATSLRTVTKDNRTKYRLLSFASKRDMGRGVLSTSSKAYKMAAYVLQEGGLVDVEQRKVNSSPKNWQKNSKYKQTARLEKLAGTSVSRNRSVAGRVKRQDYFADEFMNVADTTLIFPGKNQAVSMSEKEFVDLEEALSKVDPGMAQENWKSHSNEGRWSLCLGVLAAVGFFVFVGLLFL